MASHGSTLLVLGGVAAIAAAGAVTRRKGSRAVVRGSLVRIQAPFDETRARLERRVGGWMKIERMTLGRAVRQALLDYYSRVEGYSGDDEDDPDQLDVRYGWCARAKALLAGKNERDVAIYVHHLEGRPYLYKTRAEDVFSVGRTPGAGRAMHAELQRMAAGEKASWLVALSARIDGERSPVGFWEKMGWTVVHQDANYGNREEEAVILKDLRVGSSARRGSRDASDLPVTEGPSPLPYKHGYPVRRIALVDPSAPPPGPRDAYFADTLETQRTNPATGRGYDSWDEVDSATYDDLHLRWNQVTGRSPSNHQVIEIHAPSRPGLNLHVLFSDGGLRVSTGSADVPMAERA